MANVRDSDTSLWLHNKLGTSNDSWTGGSICSQLNTEVLRKIKECFVDLQTQVKLKLLLSFFHIPRRNVEEWKVELEEILEVALMDGDQWVCMLSEVLKTFPSTGNLNMEIQEPEDSRRIFQDLINDLKKSVKKHCEQGMLPTECLYLNKNALISVVGQQSQPAKHFTLKRKPKSAALRAELLQKSAEAATNLKKNLVPTVPVRSRGMPRKMTDTTPLKGIPSRVPTSGFRSSPASGNALSRPLSRTPAGKKEGGVKLLDINEQPLGYAQARKRKRQQELEAAAAAKKSAVETPQAGQAQTAGQQGNQVQPPATPAPQPGQTPDYAAGLVPSNPPTPAPVVQVSTQAPAATPVTPPVYVPASAAPLLPPPTPGRVSPVQNSVAPTTPNTGAVQYVQATPPATVATVTIQTVPQATTPTTSPTPTPTSQPTNVIVQQQQQGAQVQGPAGKKTLQLTREQMLEAQKMFRSANRVTRPEKALILGFMAGSRENPCPHLGNIVTIKLSENQENVQQQDSTFLTMVVETHFQMNYNTGEWKRIKKFRRMEENTTA